MEPDLVRRRIANCQGTRSTTGRAFLIEAGQPSSHTCIYHSVAFLQTTQNDVEHIIIIIIIITIFIIVIIIITMNGTMQSLLSLRPNTWSTWVNTQCRSSPCLSKTIPQKPPEYSFPSCSLSGILCRTQTKIWAIVLIFFLTVLSRSGYFFVSFTITIV